MFNRELSRGFGAWVLMADERRERMKIMRKGLSILKDGEMLRGFYLGLGCLLGAMG